MESYIKKYRWTVTSDIHTDKQNQFTLNLNIKQRPQTHIQQQITFLYTVWQLKCKLKQYSGVVCTALPLCRAPSCAKHTPCRSQCTSRVRQGSRSESDTFSHRPVAQHQVQIDVTLTQRNKYFGSSVWAANTSDSQCTCRAVSYEELLWWDRGDGRRAHRASLAVSFSMSSCSGASSRRSIRLNSWRRTRQTLSEHA